MKTLINIIIAAALVGSVSIAGCSRQSSHDHSEEHSDHGHTHGEQDQDRTTHDNEQNEDDKKDNDHETLESNKTVVIAGTTLELSIGGDFTPGKMLHLHIHQSAGPTPAAIRLWCGTESGEGSLKSKATGTGGSYHAEAEVPAIVSPATALWIEVESAEGVREAKSVKP